MIMENLHFISTDNLLEELFSRYEHCVFSGMKSHGEENITKRLHKGHLVTCMGLCMLLYSFVHDGWLKDQSNIEESHEEK